MEAGVFSPWKSSLRVHKVWCVAFWWQKRWAARTAERRLEHHQGPFDELTLWQPGGDKVAPSSLHGVRSATCYTAVSPGHLFTTAVWLSTGTMRRRKRIRQKCYFQKQTKLVALELSKGKARQRSPRSLFDCLNQRVEPRMSSPFICCPCRFALASQHPFLMFDWPLLGNHCHSDYDDDDGKTS